MFKLILIDLSGTLHIENIATSGAVSALKRLRDKKDVSIKFVTNTTKESRRKLVERLNLLGFEVNTREIFSSLSCTRDIIQKRNLNPELIISEEAMEDFEDIKPSPNPDSVIIGLAPEHFHYEKLNIIFNLLRNGAKLIAIHSAKYYKRSNGLALGPGFFIKGFEYSAQCTAEVIGKPNATFFQTALNGIDPKDAIMIGDDVYDDIEGAMKVGINGCLVKTGKYQENDENKIHPKPDYVFDCFSDAVNFILKKLNN